MLIEKVGDIPVFCIEAVGGVGKSPLGNSIKSHLGNLNQRVIFVEQPVDVLDKRGRVVLYDGPKGKLSSRGALKAGYFANENHWRKRSGMKQWLSIAIGSGYFMNCFLITIDIPASPVCHLRI